MLTHRQLKCLIAAVMWIACTGSAAWSWDEAGHIIVTRLAHHKLPDRMPPWVKTAEVADRLAYLCNEPDRWRGQKSIDLDHANNPEHYLDVEDLKEFELTLQTLPPLRRQFTDLLATMRAQHPDRFPTHDPKEDREYTKLVPGLLPYEIAEMQWKPAASWTTLKTFEANRALVSDAMIDNAKQNIVYQMGILSHFVGDGAQPLHMTKHHHGWVGENPKGYTTNKHFHSEIDGGVIELHKIDAPSLLAKVKPARPVSKDRYFSDICGYLGESFALVEPLYVLEHSGDLRKEAGKKFIEDRLIEGGAMLAGVWAAGYDDAIIDDFRVKQLLHNDKKNGTNGKPGVGASD